MKNGILSQGRVLVVAIGWAALSGTLTSSTANSQGIGAQAKPAEIGSTVEIKQLRQEILVLAARVEKLENEANKAGQDDTAAEDARVKKWEQRLGRLERAEASRDLDDKTARRPDPPDVEPSSIVRAPFVVVDAAGKTLFRVDMAPGRNRARMIIGDLLGARVEMGPNNSNAAGLGLFDASNTLRGSMIADDTDSRLSLRTGKTGGAILRGDSIGGRMTLFNNSESGVVDLAVGPGGSGSFQLGDSAGASVVEAGVVNGRGIVRAGPRYGGPLGGGLMLPYAIMGR